MIMGTVRAVRPWPGLFLMPAPAVFSRSAAVTGAMRHEIMTGLGAAPSAMMAAVFAGTVALVTVFAVDGTAAES